MKESHFKKVPIKEINRGDIFSFEKDGFFYYGRILTNHFLGLFSIIYKYKTKNLNLDSDVSNFDAISPPIILDGYSLFQIKIDGNWGVVMKDLNYRIPDHLKDLVFSNVNDLKQKKIKGFNIHGEEIEINYNKNKDKIIDDVIYGDFDIKELIDKTQ